MRKDPKKKKKLTENLFNLNTILDLDPEADKKQTEQEEKDPLHKKEKIEQHDTEEIVPEHYWYQEDEQQNNPEKLENQEKEYQRHPTEKVEYEEDKYQKYSPEKLEKEEDKYQYSPEKLEYEEDEKSAPENLVFAWDEGLVPDEYGSHVDEEEKREPYEEEILISPYNLHLNEQKILDNEYLIKLKEALDLLKSLKPNKELITAINLIEDVVKGRK